MDCAWCTRLYNDGSNAKLLQPGVNPAVLRCRQSLGPDSYQSSRRPGRLLERWVSRGVPSTLPPLRIGQWGPSRTNERLSRASRFGRGPRRGRMPVLSDVPALLTANGDADLCIRMRRRDSLTSATQGVGRRATRSVRHHRRSDRRLNRAERWIRYCCGRSAVTLSDRTGGPRADPHGGQRAGFDDRQQAARA